MNALRALICAVQFAGEIPQMEEFTTMSARKVMRQIAVTDRGKEPAWRELFLKEGLPRIPARHKREAIRMLLEDENWREKSARAIAEHVGCDHKTVTKVKRLLAGESREVVEGSAFRTRFLKACEKIAETQDPDVLWRETTDKEQWAVIKEAWKKLHRITHGGRTLPDSLYPKGLPNASTSD
jgi:hypothetical protein